jgi:ferrous iron transport protein A
MNISCAPLSTPLRVLAVEMQGDGDVIGRRLMELGFIQGAVVEVRHQAPFTSDPIAVMVRGMVVALRRYEAKRISVEPEAASGKSALEQGHP